MDKISAKIPSLRTIGLLQEGHQRCGRRTDALGRRQTGWTNESATIHPHFSRLPSVGPDSDLANAEVSVAACRTTKKRLLQQHARSCTQSRMLLQDLKVKRDRERTIARKLGSDARAALSLNVRTTGEHGMLKNFLRDIGIAEVVR